MKSYFRSKPGVAFIIAFQVLLVSASALLVIGKSPAANQAAVYAFYALAIGIAVQIGVMVKEERKRTRTGTSGEPPPP